MKTLQYFSDEYLKQCSGMTPEQIVRFLEDFRNICHEADQGKSRLISMKVPETLLNSFKTKSRLQGIPYQTRIKRLMKEWVSE